MLGGSINVTSMIGEGSKFQFTLPFAKAKASSKADPGASDSLPNVELLNLCILLVGGDKSSCGIFLEYLNHWGFRCTIAHDRDAGLEILRSSILNGSPFDLVIVDQVADRLNGLQFAKFVRANPQLQRSKMMLVCEGDASDLTQEMSDAGFSSVLGKPVKQSDLYDAIIRTIYAGPKVTAAHQLAVAMQVKPNVHQHKRILVAEDNSVNQLLVLTMLKKLGYQAQAVSNGREAVAAVSQGNYDLILMDCQMPEMDGFQATEEIKKWCAQFSIHIPIVALTANAMKDDQDRCIASGMDDYLSKPIKLDKLSAMLERCLRKLAA
jgi:CheY-like chemotaxis protein